MMIEFTRLVAKDTFSYAELDFYFKPGIHSVTGKNGAAKTSIFAILLQCLYNKNPKCRKIEAVNNSVTGKPYEIELWFTKGGVEHYIKNSRKLGANGKIEVKVGGVDKSLKRIPDNLKLIEEIVGCDYAMALDLIYQSAKSSINLLEVSTDGERKRFLNRILRFDELNFHQSRMEARVKELGGKNGRIALLTQQVDTLSASISTPLIVEDEVDVSMLDAEMKTLIELKGQGLVRKSELESQVSALQKRIEVATLAESAYLKLAELEAELCTLPDYGPYAELAEAKSKLELSRQSQKALCDLLSNQVDEAQATEKVKAQIADLEAALTSTEVPERPLGFVDSNLDKLRRLHATSQAHIATLLNEQRALQSSYAKGVCPTCGAAVEEGQFSDTLECLRGEVADHTATVKKCEEAIKKYGAMREVWVFIHNTNTTLSQLSQRLNPELNLEDLTSQLVSAKEEYAATDLLAREATKKVASCTARDKLNNDITKLRTSLPENTKSLIDLNFELKGVEQELCEHSKALHLTIDELDICAEKLKQSLAHNTECRTKKQLNIHIAESNSKVEESLSSARSALNSFGNKLDLAKRWVGILGDKGYRVNKMNSFLSNLNLTMSKYADMISLGRIQCSFFITDEGEVDFTITDANKTIDYESWSEGEKARVKMSCLFSVLELLEAMGAVSFNVLALDEVFGALDDEGKEGLFRVLEHLRTNNRAIYTIAHSEIALDMVYDSVVTATKNLNGVSRVTQ